MRINKKKKAQIFSVDLIVALITFIIIMIGIAWVWESSREKINLNEQENDMNLISIFALSSLIETPGNPSDWELIDDADFDENNIGSLGFAQDSISPWNLNYDKILKLYDLREVEYETMKKILGMRGAGYEFNIKLEKDTGFHIPGFLGGKDIAYSYGDGDPEEGNESHYGIRQFLIDNNVDFVDYEDDWETLLLEIDNYDCVILENPELVENDLTVEQQDIFKNWVSDGGIYLQKQFGRIIEMFDVTINDLAHEWGTVIALDEMISNVEIGDKVYVIEGYRISKQGNITELVRHDSSEHVLMGHWDYGDGIVYYFPDTEGIVYNISGDPIYNNTRILLDLPTNRQNIVIGLEPDENATNIIVSERIASIEDESVDLKLTLWERCWRRCP